MYYHNIKNICILPQPRVYFLNEYCILNLLPNILHLKYIKWCYFKITADSILNKFELSNYTTSRKSIFRS